MCRYRAKAGSEDEANSTDWEGREAKGETLRSEEETKREELRSRWKSEGRGY